MKSIPWIANADPQPDKKKRRINLGFLRGQGTLPEDVDAFGREEIEAMFYGESDDLPTGHQHPFISHL